MHLSKEPNLWFLHAIRICPYDPQPISTIRRPSDMRHECHIIPHRRYECHAVPQTQYTQRATVIDPKRTKNRVKINKPNLKIAKVPIIDINTAHNKMAHADINLVRNTLQREGILPTGRTIPCAPCMLFKAKAKPIAKIATQATYPGERLHMDLSGPYTKNRIKEQYWIKFKDQYSKMSWDVFSPTKDTVPYHLESKLIYFTK